MRFAPAAAASSAALAAIQAKMPVVMGQAMVVPCFLARAARSSLMLVSLPLGTLSMSSLTSIGAGTTKVPVPQRVRSLPSILPTFGRSLQSRSFSPQVLRGFIGCKIQIRNYASGKLRNEVAFVGVVHGEDNKDEFFSVGEFYVGGFRSEGAGAPAGAEFAFDLADFREVLAVAQLFSPGFTGFHRLQNSNSKLRLWQASE